MVPNSIVGDYVSTGYGGIWGLDTWSNFLYGSEEVQSPALYLSGYGNNMSLVLTTSSKYATPHVINSLIVEYSLVGRKM